MNEHAAAWCNLVGSLLGGLGGLYLAYDLLGGRKGPLALLTRVVTYSFLFGIGYLFTLGLRFALIVCLGLGVSLAVEYREAGRRKIPSRPRKNFRLILAMGALRAFSVAVALSLILGWKVAIFYFPLYTLYTVLYNRFGFAPGDHRRSMPLPNFNRLAFISCLLYGLGAGLCLALSGFLSQGSWVVEARPFTPLFFGCSIAGSAFFSSLFNPVVEYWTENLPKRTLTMVGFAFALFGFLLQALPNWVLLLR